MEESKRRVRNGFENMAPEIISDILSRLPIEWILKCKCVCKSWYSLIKDSYFVKLQLSLANDRPSSHVILDSFHSTTFPNIHLLNIEDRKAREIKRCPPEDTKKIGKYMRIMCTLNGLICLAPDFRRSDHVLIFNPLIKGDYVILPKTENPVPGYNRFSDTVPHTHVYSQNVTLGFDHLINKYKAVRMMSYCGLIECCVFEVITIGEETSWRRVVSPYAGLFCYCDRGGVFHQGSIYWIVCVFSNVYRLVTCRGSKNCRDYILEFDVTKEVFRVISFPLSVILPKTRHNGCNLFLQIMEGGSLALVENDGQLLHIWRIVKENGNPIFEYSSISIRSSIYRNARVIALLRSNGIEDFLLLERPPGRCWKDQNRYRRETQLLYCYPFSYSSKKNHRFVKLWSPQIQSHDAFIAWCFKPSLVSAKAALLRNKLVN